MDVLSAAIGGTKVVSLEGGFYIPSGLVLEYEDSKTGKVSHKVGNVSHPDGINSMLQNGHKRKFQDCHSGINTKATDDNGKRLYAKEEIKPKALEQQAKVWKAVAAGKWVITDGGTRGDPVTQEVCHFIRTRESLGATAFEKAYGKGDDAVVAYALGLVKAAFFAKNRTFKASDTKHAAVVTGKVASLRVEAQARIDAAQAKAELPEVTLPDDI